MGGGVTAATTQQTLAWATSNIFHTVLHNVTGACYGGAQHHGTSESTHSKSFTCRHPCKSCAAAKPGLYGALNKRSHYRRGCGGRIAQSTTKKRLGRPPTGRSPPLKQPLERTIWRR